MSSTYTISLFQTLPVTYILLFPLTHQDKQISCYVRTLISNHDRLSFLASILYLVAYILTQSRYLLRKRIVVNSFLA